MSMILRYNVTSTYFSSLLPCLSGHLSHLSTNTDQMPTFFKTRHVLLCLCAPMCIPHAHNCSHPTISAWTALASPTKARFHVFSPVKPSSLPGSACCCFLYVPLVLCSDSVSALVVLESFCFGLWSPQWQGPSWTCLWLLCWTWDQALWLPNRWLIGSIQNVVFCNFPQCLVLFSGSIPSPWLSLGLSDLIFLSLVNWK